MKLNFQWKKKTGQYQTGESLYLGKIIIGAYEWDSTHSRSDPDYDSKSWSGRTSLPQASRELYGKDNAEIKSRIEGTVASWFKEVFK